MVVYHTILLEERVFGALNTITVAVPLVKGTTSGFKRTNGPLTATNGHTLLTETNRNGYADTKQNGEKDPPTISQFNTTFWRWAGNIALLVILPLFLADTAPLDEIASVSPKFLAPTVGTMAEKHTKFFVSIIDPYISPLGLTQGVWDMFSHATDEAQQFEATLKFENGTLVVWRSPDWSEHCWAYKKRLQRILTWHEYMADEPVWGVKDAWARKLARDHGDDVVSVVIEQHTYAPPEHPQHLGFWDAARQPLSLTYTKHYFTVNLCDEIDTDCEALANYGGCDNQENWFHALNHCRKSCNFCHHTNDLVAGSRVSVFQGADESFYDRTIREIAEHPQRFLVEWDEYDEEWERLDRFQMRERLFTILPDEQLVEESTHSQPETVNTDEKRDEL